MSTDQTNGSLPTITSPAFGLGASSLPDIGADASSPVFGQGPSDASVLSEDATGRHPHDQSAFSSSAIPSSGNDCVEFRVSRQGASVRRLRLTGNRYTFGSAEGCSIRLSDLSLRPMHAVLIRDESRILVRGYSVPVEVNGKSVNEANLIVGDRMKLGEYEFELISITTNRASGQPTSTPAVKSDLPRGKSPRNEHFDQPVANQKQAFASESDEIVWRQQLRREIEQWRVKHVECDEREQRCDEREAHLRGRESELWSRAENLYRREAQLQSQESAVFQMHDEYAQRQQELMRLRDEARAQQDTFRKREEDFARQEIEYQKQLEETAAQLTQSQTQAEAATDAVRKIREQFDALNDQIESLSLQQGDLKENEGRQREEHQRLRGELESQRDQAIDAQAESEARRREAEARVEEMSVQLEMMQQSQGEISEVEHQQIEAGKRTIEELQLQIETLQNTVAEAESESGRLRSDYTQALESVSQLELLVAQSNDRGDADREAWAIEAESLRSEIERLSEDLRRTGEELSELRDSNVTLTSRLEKVQQQRDEAIEDLGSRPTQEEFESLRQELEAAQGAVEGLQQGWKSDDASSDEAASLEQLADEDSGDSASPGLASSAENRLAKFAGLGLADLADEPEAGSSPEFESSEVAPLGIQEPSLEDLEPSVESQPVIEGRQVEASQVEVSQSDEEDDAAWPTYQVDESAIGHADDDVEMESAESDSVWQSDSDAWGASNEQSEPESASSTSELSEPQPVEPQQVEPEASELEPSLSSDEDVASSPEWDAPSPWESTSSSEALKTSEEVEASSEVDPPIDELKADLSASDEDVMSHPSDEEEASFAGGSLASMLIADLDSEVSDADTPPTPTELESQGEGNVASDEIESSYQGTQVWNRDESEDESSISSPIQDADHNNSDQHGLEENVSQTFAWDREYAEEAVNAEDHDANPWGMAHDEQDETLESDSGTDEPALMAGDDVEATSFMAENAFADVADVADESLAMNADSSENPISEHPVSESESEFPELESPESEFADAKLSEPEIAEPDVAEPDVAEPEIAEPEVVEQTLVNETLTSDIVEQTSSENVPDATQETEVDEDDDSIEAYMNRLLRRVQGTPGDDQAPVTESVSLSSSSVSLQTDTSSSSPLSESVATPDPVDPDAPLVPRSQAPERNSDLSAMRDLANQSARSAISRSARIQTRNIQIASIVNFAVAGIALIFGLGAMLLMSGYLPLFILVVSIVVAVISVRDGLRNLSEARGRTEAAAAVSKSRAAEELATEEEESASPA